MRTALSDNVGKKFARLTVIGVDPDKKYQVLCQCECGNICSSKVHPLRSGATKSCGCLNRENTAARRKTHGHTSGGVDPLITKVYRAWSHIKDRCLRPNTAKYKNHGGRGITMHPSWVDDFPQFLLDVGLPPSADMSVDRIDNDGDYTPQNVRWATSVEQCNNTRRNTYVTFHGETKTITEWSAIAGIHPRTIAARINDLNWPVELALTKKPKYSNRTAKDLA